MTPRLGIEPFASEGSAPGWTVRWRLTNLGATPLRLLRAVQPHAQFRSDELTFARELAPGESTEVALPVRFAESPGSVVENPFLILGVREGNEDWRVLARVRVTAGARGEPKADGSVVISTQRVGLG
jgi:hypothetical protein